MMHMIPERDLSTGIKGTHNSEYKKQSSGPPSSVLYLLLAVAPEFQ